MKKIIALLSSIVLLIGLSGCSVENKMALIGVWHQDFEGLPANYDTISFFNDGRFGYKQFEFQDEENFMGSGLSGNYGIADHKLIFGVTGGSSTSSGVYELAPDEATAMSSTLKYSSRHERFYEIKGDRLYLYEHENKAENTGALFTGIFHKGKPKDCPLLKYQTTGLMY